MLFHFFSEEIRFDVSNESSARQRIHMKNQALFSLEDKSKKLKCCLLQLLFGALSVKADASCNNMDPIISEIQCDSFDSKAKQNMIPKPSKI